MNTLRTESTSKITMVAWATPTIRWFNFFPGRFKKQKSNQLQDLVDEMERIGNTVYEICENPFVSSVKIGQSKG